MLLNKLIKDCAIKNAVLKQVRSPCKYKILSLITLKIHVHGLVLHDVIVMLEDTISEEIVNYLQEYFQGPFSVFRKELLHIFDGCPDIELKEWLGKSLILLQENHKILLKQVWCPPKTLFHQSNLPKQFC